ncbi:hypothetical protein NLG97_g8635 [Lecanicillium saksenae]|uniref:Uncharacterized protein n=1 Tax=Lecanicillium saksenae TaxID=468837 RepID=A0ACC1QIB5_9HYPO|nr:hypothetical protein NLG97_g8635 [Lecanicillium saksenae]
MTDITSSSRLLSLPWEVRRPIIATVLPQGRSKLPSLSDKLIKSRVRLRNCFDASHPEVTNFYVPRYKNHRVNGNGLRATNRQLRYETDLLIEEELKSGKVEVPFVLDIMLVREIGVFPSWMSFPYQPEHLKKLTINLRIIRPGTATLPDEWVEMARYKYHKYVPTLDTCWHLFMGIVYYALGCFSVKPDPLLPRVEPGMQPVTRQQELIAKTAQKSVQNNDEKATTGRAQPAGTTSTKGKKAKGKQLTTRFARKKGQMPKKRDILSHQSDMFDAYRLSSPSYVTDELVLSFAPREYDVNNEPVPLPQGERPHPWQPLPPGVLETCKESRFYEEGCIQFSRDLFRDYSTQYMDWSDMDEERRLMYEGSYTTQYFYEYLIESFGVTDSSWVYESDLGTYLQVLAQSVGVLSCAGPLAREWSLICQHPGEWTYHYDWWEDQEDYRLEVIERGLARELASDEPDEERLIQLRILQARHAHGWILEDDYD